MYENPKTYKETTKKLIETELEHVEEVIKRIKKSLKEL